MLSIPNKRKPIIIGSNQYLFVLLALLHVCQNLSAQVKEINIGKNLSVIAEQDPNGIYFGLRDTINGKLISAYAYQQIWNFKDGFAIVYLNGKYGLIDKMGGNIIEPEYDYPKTEIECGCIAFEIGYGPVIIFDTSGKAVRPVVSGMTGLLPCQQRITFGNYQYGMMNFNNDTILPFNYAYAYLLSEGFCAASKVDHTGYNKLFGLYDLNGKQVLPHQFEWMDGFSCGRALVKKDGRYGVIDESGKELFYTDYGRIDRFYNNYAIVYTKPKNDVIAVGIIDREGKEIVPAIYQWLDYVQSFSEGLVAMPLNHKYGFIDTNGNVVIPFKFEKVEPFVNGVAKVWPDWHHVGYINKKGQEIIPADFAPMDHANLRRYFEKYIIGLKDSVYHVFDFSGNEIARLTYEYLWPLYEKEKSFIVSMKNKWGILDSNLILKIPIEYESIETIFRDKLIVRKRGKVGIINYDGKSFVPSIYTSISGFMDNQFNYSLALVEIKNKFGVINSRGKLIIPAKYEEIGEYHYGLAVVKQKGKYGYVNQHGKEIIAPIYTEAKLYDGYSAEVILNGESFKIDHLGKRLLEEEDY